MRALSSSALNNEIDNLMFSQSTMLLGREESSTLPIYEEPSKFVDAPPLGRNYSNQKIRLSGNFMTFQNSK